MRLAAASVFGVSTGAIVLVCWPVLDEFGRVWFVVLALVCSVAIALLFGSEKED